MVADLSSTLHARLSYIGCPFSVRCVFRHMAVIIGRAIVPPDWTALPERHLGGINGGSSSAQIAIASFRISHARLAFITSLTISWRRFGNGGISRPPEAAGDDEATVRCGWSARRH